MWLPSRFRVVEDLSKTLFLLRHGYAPDLVDDDEYEPNTSLSLSLKPDPLISGYMGEQESVFVTSKNGTFNLVDCQSHKVLMSSETGKPTYAQHHSGDSEYHLDYAIDNKLYFIKTNSCWLKNEYKASGPYNVEEFIRKKPEKYLDGGRLTSKITTTEYLVDYKTCKIVDTFCSDEVQSYQQKPSPVKHDQLITVKRIDYELTFYSSTTHKCLWYLRFARFKAWYETAFTLRMRENVPYDKQYIQVYHGHRGSLTNIFEADALNISSETRDLLNKDDDDDTKAIQGTSKKKKKARKAKKGSTTANTDEKMIIELDETDIVHIDDSQTPELLLSKKEIGKGCNNTNVFEVNGDKDVETQVQYPEVPDPNYNHVGSHFVKFPLDSPYLVSKRCVCSLHDLMLFVKNGRGQAKLPVNANKAVKFFSEPYNWVKLTRDIAGELAKLHKNGTVHGDLNPHNVYIDIDNNAIIPKDLNAAISSSIKDADSSRSHSKANDCYNMGRIIVYIASNGKHEFHDASKNDMNNSKDRKDLELIKDEPEAYDIASKLLHQDALLRPTAERVLFHCLHWDLEWFRSYIEDTSDQFGALWDDAYKNKTEVKLADDFKRIENDVFDGNWSSNFSKLDKKILKEKNKFKRDTNFDEYDCTSVGDFLLYIKNVCHHYPKNQIGDRDSFLTRIRRSYPKLLMEVYKLFDDGRDWTGTILYKYHMKR